MPNKIIDKLKAFANGEHSPEYRVGMMGYVLVPKSRPDVLQIMTTKDGTAVCVWIDPNEAEEYRQMLEPLGTNDYCVRPVVLHPPQAALK